MSTPANEHTPDEGKRSHPVEIVIDGNSVTAPDKTEDERTLLGLIGKTVADTYLVLVKGKRDRESYKDRPDEPIKLHKGMKFVTVSTGPTPVS